MREGADQLECEGTLELPQNKWRQRSAHRFRPARGGSGPPLAIHRKACDIGFGKSASAGEPLFVSISLLRLQAPSIGGASFALPERAHLARTRSGIGG